MNTVEQAVQFVRSKTDFSPRAALGLGSGFDSFASLVETQCSIPYAEIPGFPVSTVAGHKGQFCFGMLDGVPVVVQQGRVHAYEGYPMEQVVLPVRLMRRLGARALLLTNAAGGIRSDLTPGSLMLLTDHISSFVPSPLRGKNDEALGPRFPDMSRAYDPSLCSAVRAAARACAVELKEGVYLQAPGPQFETPAEIRMYALLGADAVGMSTVCETIAAVHCGMRVCAVSCITNRAAGLSAQPLSHEEVQTIAAQTAPSIRALLRSSVVQIANNI